MQPCCTDKGAMAPPKYIYICSAGHSGSTLLDLLIGSHPRIASLGEIAQLPKNIALNTQCSCGLPVRSCAVWSEVMRKVGSQIGIDLTTNPYGLRMGYTRASAVIDTAHQTRLYLARRKLILGLYYLRLKFRASFLDSVTASVIDSIDNNVRVFEAVRQVLAVDAVVDSSKSYLKALALYRRHPDRVRILLLTRDGRAVSWSNMKRGASRAAAVREWRHQYTRALPLLRQHVSPAHILTIQYESVATDTRATLQSICSFVDLPFDDSMMNFRAKTHHVANGNRMRMSSTSEIKLDNEWRSRLTFEDLRFFERKAGPLNRMLGYT